MEGVFHDTCPHGAHLPIEDTRMGCFGEKKKRKYFFSGTVRYTLIPIFLSFVYTKKKKYQQGGGRDIFRVVSADFSFA